MKHFIGWAFAAVLCTAAIGARAVETGSAQEGHTMAKQVCSKCHAVESGDAYSPNLLAPTFDEIAGTPGMTETALFAALRTSHKEMPNLILSSDEIANLSAYILSLKQ
ncbi:MAG: c-type cytochrome [Dongiaceae bacterium]